MARLALRLLGPLEILLDSRPICTVKLAKVRALLAYLAVERGHAHSRAMLAGLFWPDYAESSALTSLRTALAMLRGALGDQDVACPFLLIDRETVRLNPQSDHPLDTAILDAVPIDRLASAGTASLQEAVDLYRGEFLEGLALDGCPAFEEWLSTQREHYRQRAIEILHQLAERYLNNGEYRTAEDCARRGLAVDPLDEEGHRQVMCALGLSGRRAEALQQYEACARALAGELGVEPSPETRSLYEGIRARSLVSTKAEARGMAEGRVPVDPGAPSSPTAPVELPALHQLPPPPADFAGRELELRVDGCSATRECRATRHTRPGWDGQDVAGAVPGHCGADRRSSAGV